MIGQEISHYHIVEELGRGGMGVVYKAQDMKLDRSVALKFLPTNVSADAETRTRFLQEAKAAAALNHSNICTIYGVEESAGTMFIAMEYVEGGTLRTRLPFAKVDDALTMAIQIGEALQEAHARGIVHRDIKADNIMVTSRGQAKVMDFGLAKVKGMLRLTRTSSAVGTIGYMAPEQLQGGEADHRSDIFSFGVLLFEMLTGKFPFRGEHEAAITYSVVNEEPESVFTHCPDASPELDRILHRALEKDPAHRYQHVDDMVSELRRVESSSLQPAGQVSKRSETSKKSNVRIWLLVASGVLLFGVAWMVFFGKPSRKITSMAVLPLVNTAADPTMEYLSDGITEGLINSLSRLPGLKMMSRNSVFRYKGKEVDPQKVGKELNVGSVLLGRIAQSAAGLAVSVELINTSDNSHIWGAQYEQSTSGIVALQKDISRELSQQLGIPLTGNQVKQLTRNGTENTEAYQLYLKGRFYWNKRTAEGFRKAIEMFQAAIEKDRGYALAYAGLADCYVLMPGYYILPPSESYAKAKMSATRAIELDNTLAEPHTDLATMASEYEWNFKAAELEFRRSLELNPNNATTHHWYGEFLAAMGRKQEGLAEIQKGIEIDPLAPVIYSSSSWVARSIGDYDRAQKDADRALEIDPGFPRALLSKVQAYIEQGQGVEALKYAHEAILASENGVEYRAWLGYACGRLGKRREAMKIVTDLLELSKHEFVPPILIAIIYGGLGEKDKAFGWLEKVYHEHAGDLIYLNVECAWKLLRDDPRFEALVRKVGLPP